MNKNDKNDLSDISDILNDTNVKKSITQLINSKPNSKSNSKSNSLFTNSLLSDPDNISKLKYAAGIFIIIF